MNDYKWLLKGRAEEIQTEMGKLMVSILGSIPTPPHMGFRDGLISDVSGILRLAARGGSAANLMTREEFVALAGAAYDDSKEASDYKEICDRAGAVLEVGDLVEATFTRSGKVH